MESDCVSASFSPDDGRCQLNQLIHCSTFFDVAAGWTLLRHTGRKSCNISAGYSYFEEPRFCVKLYDPVVPAQQSNPTCMNDGGRLIRIASREHQDFVANYLGEEGNNITDVVVNGYGSGYDSSRKWIWIRPAGVSPSPRIELPFTYWIPGQTHMSRTRRCLVLNAPWRYQWKADTCRKTFNFLCEIPIDS